MCTCIQWLSATHNTSASARHNFYEIIMNLSALNLLQQLVCICKAAYDCSFDLFAIIIIDNLFDSIITAVSAGKADMGMAGMTVTEDRKKNVDFSQTYASAIQAIIVPEGSDIKTADDMEGKKIGVMQGFTGDLNCTEQFGEDSVVRFNKSAEAVMALQQGKIDCIVIDNEPAKKIIEANKGLQILDSKYSQEDYAIAFAKGNDGLHDAVDKALGELIDDGTVEKIMNEYIVAD